MKAAKRPRLGQPAVAAMAAAEAVSEPTVLDADWAKQQAEGLINDLVTYPSFAEVQGGSYFYLIEKDDRLWNFCNNDVTLQSYLSNFVQLSPTQPCTKANGRAVGPIKNTSPFAGQLKAFLRALAGEANDMAKHEDACACSATAYWNLATLKAVFFERSFSPTIRYQHRGVSEMVVFTLKAFVGFRSPSL